MIKNKIKVLRAEFDMTQEDLAEKVGVTRQTILAIENTKYYPTLKLAFDIAEVFKIGIENVFYIDKNE